MASEEYTTGRYEYNNVLYDILATKLQHESLQNDPEYFKTYMSLNNNNEIVGFTNVNENNDDNNSNFNWCRKTTLLLIEKYRDKKESFRDPKKKKKDVWLSISKEFETMGYKISPEELDKKFRNLKRTYKCKKDNSKSSVTGRGSISWEYYDQFEDIFCDDKTIHCPTTIASFTIGNTKENLTASNILNESSLSRLSSSDMIIEETIDKTTELPKSKKDNSVKRNKQLFEYRKKQQEIESERVVELRKLRLAIEKSNEIQEKRNELLAKLVDK